MPHQASLLNRNMYISPIRENTKIKAPGMPVNFLNKTDGLLILQPLQEYFK